MNTNLFKLLFAFFLIVFVSTNDSKSQSIVEKYGNLSVNGAQIVDKDGTPVQLKGMSFFWSQWQGKYYTYNTVKWLRDEWKCSVLRAAMGVESGGYLQNPATEKQKIFTVIDAAIDLGIYVVVDWHDHNAQRHRVQAQNFFVEVAKKYGNKPNIIYEIFNEPLGVTWKDSIKPYNIAVIDSIRKYDPDNLIVCGTRTWSQEVEEASLDPIKDTNIAYSLHYYAATHKQWLRDKALKAINNKVALFVTEYGTCESSGNGKIDYTETKAWWTFLDKYKISYINWSIADKVETASALKPGASENGGWDSTLITESGRFVRANLCGLPFSPVGTNIQIKTEDKINLYPNPVRETLTILMSQENLRNGIVEVFDQSGRIVLKNKLNGNSLKLSLENIIPGTYQLRISNGSALLNTSFTKI